MLRVKKVQRNLRTSPSHCWAHGWLPSRLFNWGISRSNWTVIEAFDESQLEAALEPQPEFWFRWVLWGLKLFLLPLETCVLIAFSFFLSSEFFFCLALRKWKLVNCEKRFQHLVGCRGGLENKNKEKNLKLIDVNSFCQLLLASDALISAPTWNFLISFLWFLLVSNLFLLFFLLSSVCHRLMCFSFISGRLSVVAGTWCHKRCSCEYREFFSFFSLPFFWF